MPIDWSLLKTPDIAKSALEGFEEGRKLRRERESRKALNALLNGGASEQSGAGTPGYGDDVVRGQKGQAIDYSALTTDDMRTALLFQQMRREQAKASREGDFNRAAFDYTTQNALLGFGVDKAGAVPSPAKNALAPEVMQVPGTFAPTLPDEPRPTEPANPAFAVFGQPKTSNDRAFLRMLEIDPSRALKFKSELRDNMVKMLGQEHDVYAAAIDRLAFAKDEPSYQQTIAELAPMVSSIGGDITKIVPPTYPGPDGIRELTMKALDAKDRISAFISQDRANIHAKNVEADNIRQDRNTDSLINDRQRRTSIYADRSARAGQGGGGGRGSGGGGRSAAPVKVNTPAEAMKLPKGTRYATPDGKVMVR